MTGACCLAVKICPICNTHNSAEFAHCSNCGAGLARVLPWQEGVGSYPPQQGEMADLAESRLRWRGGSCLTLVILALAGLVCVGVLWQLVDRVGIGALSLPAPTAPAPAIPSPAPTASPVPTLFLPTVTATPSPRPTPTDTPTRAPCLQEVSSGDSLIGLVARCGHQDLDVIEEVLAMNDLGAPEHIQAGRQLLIPWPTETPAPGAPVIQGPAADEAASPGAAQAQPARQPASDAPALATPTLQAGVMWHTVSAGETIVGLAWRYGTDLKVLSELNPEVAFSQCDFGQASGGPSCVVTVYEHQRLRVPAPTPTATLSPTPSGIASPTPTAVINLPVLYSPPDNRNFNHGELVTLRWVAAGALAEGEIWRVIVENLGSGEVYTDTTGRLSHVLPVGWKDTRPGWHGYRWRVQLLRPDGDTSESGARRFLWETGS